MSIFERFKPSIKLTGYVYDMQRHLGWGNAINWSNYEKRRVYGHLQRRPRVGDELISKMESGKIARFVFTNVEYSTDPHDMFFADLTDIGYEGETPINRVKEAENREVEPREEGIRLLR